MPARGWQKRLSSAGLSWFHDEQTQQAAFNAAVEMGRPVQCCRDLHRPSRPHSRSDLLARPRSLNVGGD